MMISVGHDRRLRYNGTEVPCAIGRSGVLPAAEKREGDGMTPMGAYPLRYVFYRADRGPRPQTNLMTVSLRPWLGWCDDAGHDAYNQPVMLPFDASHEKLWRNDGLYDLIVVLGHNDDPPVPGMGSAIFLHCAAPGLKPTAGCVAIPKDDLYALLAQAGDGDQISIG